MWLYNVVDEIGRDITKNIYIKNNKTLKNLIRFCIVLCIRSSFSPSTVG